MIAGTGFLPPVANPPLAVAPYEAIFRSTQDSF